MQNIYLNGGTLGWMVENGGGAAVVKESPDAEVIGDGVVNTVVSVARMPELVDLKQHNGSILNAYKYTH